MVKMTGVQFKAFLSDPSVWEAGADVWCEDDLYLVDGVQVNAWTLRPCLRRP